MDFKVFLSDDALKDLERIVAYIAPHNPVAAERLGHTNYWMPPSRSVTFPNAGAPCRNSAGPNCGKSFSVPIASSAG
jgi:plasmid stabilization system protein ParE